MTLAATDFRSADSVDTLLPMIEADLHTLGHLAHGEKLQRFGRRVTTSASFHLNLSNVCKNRCQFCRYRRDADAPDRVQLTVGESLTQIEWALARGADDIHLTSGLDDWLTLEKATELLRGIRRLSPRVFIKAFTAVEIDHLARGANRSVLYVLQRLQEAGLDALPGGGAEIFSARVRSVLCPEKLSGENWLAIHRQAHRIGLTSNATMLVGHIETSAERVEHLLALRHLQAETGGISAFLLLPRVPVEPSQRMIAGNELMKLVAISRLILHNIPHIKTFWPIWTVPMAQLALSYGADDFDGSMASYRITALVEGEHNPVADNDKHIPVADVQPEDLIASAGFEAVRRSGRFDRSV